MRTLENLNLFLVEKLGQKPQPTLLGAFNALCKAYGGEGKAKTKQQALNELEKVFVGPAEGGVTLAKLEEGSVAPALITLISKADIPAIVLPKHAGAMFYECSALTSLDVSNFDTKAVTEMAYMFAGCSALTSLDVSNFNTEAVTSMYGMFGECSALTSLDVSNFNTKVVTNMGSMFAGCSALTSVNVSNFNTEAVTSMYGMFGECSALTSLDVSNFNTEAVTNMGSMFAGCSALTSVNVSNFNTKEVTSMDSMFAGCSALTSVNVSNFNTEAVTSMYGMFGECSALTSLDVSNFNTKAVTNMGSMFAGCSALTSVKFPGEGKWAANSSIMTFDISAAPLDIASIQGLVTALATKTNLTRSCSLKLKSANWEAAKAADSTLETTLAAKNWVVTAV